MILSKEQLTGLITKWFHYCFASVDNIKLTDDSKVYPDGYNVLFDVSTNMGSFVFGFIVLNSGDIHIWNSESAINIISINDSGAVSSNITPESCNYESAVCPEFCQLLERMIIQAIEDEVNNETKKEQQELHEKFSVPKYMKAKTVLVFDPDQFKQGKAYAISEEGQSDYMPAILVSIKSKEICFLWYTEDGMQPKHIDVDDFDKYRIRLMVPEEE